MSTDPILSVQLDNGLTMQCIDQSRKIAADRWYICIWIEIVVCVDKKWFTHFFMDEKKYQKIRDLLGPSVVFKQKHERNFVSEGEKAQIIETICQHASEMGRTYFCHADFPAKYILKCLHAKQTPFN
ncbi:hypothetical protein [Desulfosarcina ovata]|uniref:Uncharacterized protein n=1 Tax=Desulfosarcina ovata subsp. ovata TaxID=2752305 RepID=A0A5K8AD64_9BACT|nr:hypothetical protein [Desulfosarcina ovata]BBO90469.1 hypothetical protein DSCOOX_36490 [Desulfosarcina ovata subsp. ovata]